MKAQGIKSGYAFARNPVVLRDDFPVGLFDPAGGSFTLSMDGGDFYGGRFSPPVSVDISEILDAFVPFFPDPPDDASCPVVMVEDAEELSCRTVSASFEYAGEVSDISFTVIPGGISRQNFRRMAATGQDIFNARFLNPRNNFFLTTRTAGWRVVVKETELAPLYFLLPEEDSLSVSESVSGSSLSFGPLAPGVYVLDVDALRRRFMAEKDVIANVFDIYRGVGFSCRIVVERAAMSRDRCRLRFRNSLGVFEIVELTGALSVSPDYPESEDASFRRYDPVAGGFCTVRGRVERRQSVNVSTGVKRPDEVRFLMDMLSSEEVYLLDVGLFPLRVIPSVEEFSYRFRPDAPESFTLKLDMSDQEVNIMQEIADGSEGRRPRVFSGQFTEQFN